MEIDEGFEGIAKNTKRSKGKKFDSLKGDKSIKIS